MKYKLVLNMVVSDSIKAMSLYENIFGATKGDVFLFPERKGANEANIIIGNVGIRLLDENDDYDCHPPNPSETDSIWLQLEVDDVEDTLQKAKKNGCQIDTEPSEFMGVIHAQFKDPFGYIWTIHKVINQISFEERYATYEKIYQDSEIKKQD